MEKDYDRFIFTFAASSSVAQWQTLSDRRVSELCSMFTFFLSLSLLQPLLHLHSDKPCQPACFWIVFHVNFFASLSLFSFTFTFVASSSVAQCIDRPCWTGVFFLIYVPLSLFLFHLNHFHFCSLSFCFAVSSLVGPAYGLFFGLTITHRLVHSSGFEYNKIMRQPLWPALIKLRS